MKVPLPKSLTGQTIGVLLIALVVSHVVGIFIYALEHRQVVSKTEAHDLADRLVGMVKLLERLPAQWRQDIVRESDGRTFHVMLGAEPDPIKRDLNEALSREVARYLRSQFPSWSADRIRVSLSDTPLFEMEKILRNQSIVQPETSLDVHNPQQAYDFLHVSIQLEGDEWLNLVGALARPELLPGGSALAYILSLAVGVAAFAVWILFRVTGPVNEFARTADRLGKDIQAQPLPETGPVEIAAAARAFNVMQERLRRLVQNRSQMLAAISHDLRTPVTLLRLRAEAVSDPQERTKLLHTLNEMETMITSVLEFTKATGLDEPKRRVDISAMLGSICDDMADVGAKVEFEATDTISYSCRRMSLQRALTNLIDNACKYGGVARVSIEQRNAEIDITIDDDGPGIPVEQQELVFMPFQRIDTSRSTDAGGVGLGLSIAQTIIHGHGGKVTLSNRAEGGLRVRVSLPV